MANGISAVSSASGRKIGTQKDAEGKVHMESNTWAVISGVADEEKGKSAMDSVDEYLYTPYGLMLNAPSFTVPDDEIGFVTRVYPGVKENGSIFSHPNPWAWVAEAKLGRGDRAMKFYNALLPENQNDIIERREAEPYSYCQFIMGRDHTAFGPRAASLHDRARAAGHILAATRYLLGVRPDFDGLTVDPCIPSDWKSFRVVRKWRGRRIPHPGGKSRRQTEGCHLDDCERREGGRQYRPHAAGGFGLRSGRADVTAKNRDPVQLRKVEQQ